MNTNVEFLNYIHQNAQMGKDTVKQLIDISNDEQFKNMLKSQHNEYVSVFDKTNTLLEQFNKKAKGTNVLSKVTFYLIVNMQTLTNKTASHLSEMLIQGSTMGIIQITKKISEYNTANTQILDLANQLLNIEQKNVDECKKFLGSFVK